MDRQTDSNKIVASVAVQCFGLQPTDLKFQATENGIVK